MVASDFSVKVGRKRTKIDMKVVAEMLRDDEPIGIIAENFGVSYVTMWKRIQEHKEMLRSRGE